MINQVLFQATIHPVLETLVLFIVYVLFFFRVPRSSRFAVLVGWPKFVRDCSFPTRAVNLTP